MIGKVIEGRYTGAVVNKLPDKNVLFIVTEDNNKIALSKSNVISIDDVTDQYFSDAAKILMVMWNNFETSIIRIGFAPNSNAKLSVSNSLTDNHKRMAHTLEYSNAPEQQSTPHQSVPSNKTTKDKKPVIKLVIAFCLLMILIMTSLFFVNQRNEVKIAEEQASEQRKLISAFQSEAYSRITDVISSEYDSVYYGDLTKTQILDTLTVTYADETIVDNTYSSVATYRLTMGDLYYFYEMQLVVDLNTGAGNGSLIRYYTEDSGLDTNYPIESNKSSTGLFTNKYGTATTRCAYDGCSKYIASSGDTNCCVSHSNKCLNCKCYIDSDAAFCMDCLFGNN